MPKRTRKKAKEKMKRSKPVTRLVLPSNKRHKSKKDYKRQGKLKPHLVQD